MLCLKAFLNRIFDITLASMLLIPTLPLLLITALLIKIYSPGPILYRQKRVGLNGQTFDVYKFRSMRSDAEKNGPIWASKNDTRVTKVGKVIRLFRIDEIPQVINIFKGEMSFIGPRPERPEFVEKLSKLIPRYSERHKIKPGLTGWAQVKYSYGASIEDTKIKLVL